MAAASALGEVDEQDSKDENETGRLKVFSREFGAEFCSR
jgi:hypothetical protein